jgi:uncharacterized membrane protein
MKRHTRFLLAFALGLIVTLIAHVWPLREHLRIQFGATTFFLVYLGLMLHFTRQITPGFLRQRAAASDEGTVLILALAVAAVAISVTSIVLILNGPGGGNALERVVSLGSVPLGWATLHTVAAFHYAHLYYRNDADGEGGLGFPGTTEPGAWDFLYFSFGVGMTAQVSDVIATTTPFRQTVMFHAVGSFFYNTVILALAVNAAMTSH